MFGATSPERVRSALRYLSPDDRKVWVRQAMAVKSEYGDAGFDLWDEWGSRSSAHNANDARSVWKSVEGVGKISIATLFYDAKQAGWKDDTTYKEPSAAEIEKRRALRAKRDAEADAQKAAEQDAAAVKALALWDAAEPCDTHRLIWIVDGRQRVAKSRSSWREVVTRPLVWPIAADWPLRRCSGRSPRRIMNGRFRRRLSVDCET